MLTQALKKHTTGMRMLFKSCLIKGVIALNNIQSSKKSSIFTIMGDMELATGIIYICIYL